MYWNIYCHDVDGYLLVSLLVPPEVRIPTPRLGQSVGRETILECKVAASPHGSIVWRKDGRNIPLHIYKYSTMVYDEEDRHEKTLALNIIDIDKSDFGRYTCEAENKLGSDKEHMLLYGKLFWDISFSCTPDRDI